MTDLNSIEAALAKNHATVSGALEEVKSRMTEVEKLQAREVTQGTTETKTWGNSLTSSTEFKEFASAGFKGRAALEVKAALTTAPTSAGALTPADRDPNGVLLPRRRMTIRSLLGPGRTGTSSVEYFEETLFTNNAEVVAETAEKPESEIAYALKSAPVRTIAHWIPASRQAMDDNPQLESLVDGSLRYGLALKEESQLLYGDGTGENIHGMVPQATAYETARTIGTDTNLDIIRHAISQAEEAELPASGIILNTMDWMNMAGLKDAENRYIGNGPFGAGEATLWRLPVVWTNAITQGTFLVGSFETATQLWDRMDPEVAVSDSDKDNFIKNMLTIRGEERLAFAVKRPAALIAGALI